jgi:ribonuclease HI
MYKLFTDGGSRGNPGKAAIAYFIYDTNDNLIDFGGSYIGLETNNTAEYSALIDGLKLCAKNGIQELNCYLDSELVVKQLNKQYKVSNESIKILFDKVIQNTKFFKTVTFNHIPRAENKHADKLVNIILDQKI